MTCIAQAGVFRGNCAAYSQKCRSHHGFDSTSILVHEKTLMMAVVKDFSLKMSERGRRTIPCLNRTIRDLLQNLLS